MANRISETVNAKLLEAVALKSDGTTAQELFHYFEQSVPLRTLQYRLSVLVRESRLTNTGKGRNVKYHLANDLVHESVEAGAPIKAGTIAMSRESEAPRYYVRQALTKRTPVGYDRRFLETYHPNETFYLSENDRARLAASGKQDIVAPAGTFARHILNRLLIDLAWNSSRLEGNTYSLIDTRRLIQLGQEAAGRPHVEAQMILNHKDAIEFLVEAADDIGFNRFTILNLHGMLANNLLPDPEAAGRLRYIAVGIEKSVFHPLEVPQRIEECFDLILAKAELIEDPFEQSFFIMVQLPYLQPFDDVNKRVSRLAANIPFIRRNMSPLAFTDVPLGFYTEAMLALYELNNLSMMRDLFVWAYERSAERLSAVRQSLGEPDPLRLRYRSELRTLIADIVRAQTPKTAATSLILAWADEHIVKQDRESFIETAETELSSLHEGNFARYQLRPSEFAAWRKIWNR